MKLSWTSQFSLLQVYSRPSWALLWCLFRWHDVVNFFSQWEQKYRFSPVCDVICFFKSDIFKNLFSHCEQHTFLSESPLWWYLICVFKACEWLLLKSQWEQLKGLTPEWVLKCTNKLLDVVNFLSHCVQLYGLSPVCVLSCTFKISRRPNVLPHWVQQNGFSPVCALSWSSKCFLS